MTPKTVLFLGGPDDGRALSITKQRVAHGEKLRTFMDRPMSMETAAAVVKGCETTIARHAALDQFVYRVVLFRCGEVDRFVAIDDSLPDEAALEMLFDRATRSRR